MKENTLKPHVARPPADKDIPILWDIPKVNELIVSSKIDSLDSKINDKIVSNINKDLEYCPIINDDKRFIWQKTIVKPKQRFLFRKWLQDMIRGNKIENCSKSDIRFCIPHLNVKKKDGIRPVLRMDLINDLITPITPENLNNCPELINKLRKYKHIAKCDLTSAFHSIPMHIDSRKFFGFYFEGKFYRYSCLPMGCKDATAAMHLVVSEIAKDHNWPLEQICWATDDFFAGANTVTEADSIMKKIKDDLQRYGFRINSEKSASAEKDKCILGLFKPTDSDYMEIPNGKKKEILNNKIENSLTPQLAFYGQWFPQVMLIAAKIQAAGLNDSIHWQLKSALESRTKWCCKNPAFACLDSSKFGSASTIFDEKGTIYASYVRLNKSTVWTEKSSKSCEEKGLRVQNKRFKFKEFKDLIIFTDNLQLVQKLPQNLEDLHLIHLPGSDNPVDGLSRARVPTSNVWNSKISRCVQKFKSMKKE